MPHPAWGEAMTTITINENEHRITVSGHSGYAQKGQDIVCAGISSLTWALAAQLSRESLLLIVTESDGNMEIKYAPGAEPYLDMYQTGVELIEVKYPDYVTVQGRKSRLFSDNIKDEREEVG